MEVLKYYRKYKNSRKQKAWENNYNYENGSKSEKIVVSVRKQWYAW